MDAKQLEKCQRRLDSQIPLIGMRWRRMAIQALSRDGSPEAMRILAEAAMRNGDDLSRASLIAALRGIKDQRAIDSVCSVWASRRNPTLAQLIVESGWVAAAPDAVTVLTALKTKRFNVVCTGGAGLVDPLLEAGRDVDKEIAQAARDCWPRLQNPEAIDYFCTRWADRRDSLLGQAVEQGKYVARAPALVHVLSGLKSGNLELVSDGSADVVGPLLQACEDSDRLIADGARTALGQLKRPEAKEALCGRCLESDQTLAREIAVTAQYAPRELSNRAMFYFLTEQWEKYESLDFDRSILGAAYENGSRTLRGRIAERARRAGRTEWIGVIAGGRQDRHLHEMTDEEWATALAVLNEGKRWLEMWRLAQSAPADWSVRLLSQLGQAGWRPVAEHEQEGFVNLLELAARCREEPPFLGRLMRFAVPLNGHTDAVSCLAINRSGQMLASGSNDYTVRLWNLTDASPRKVLEGHTDWVTGVALGPDEQILASSSRDHSLRLWSFPDGTLLKRLDGHTGDIRCLAFNLDGRILLTGSDDATIRLWRMPDGQPLATLEGHADIISCLAVSPNGRMLATGSYDNQVRLWSLPDGAPLATLAGHGAMVNCLAFSPDSRILASGSKDRTVLLWSLPRGTMLKQLEGHHDDISCLAISPDGQVLASGSWDSTVGIWSFPAGEPLDSLGAMGTVEGHGGWVNSLVFSPDGRVLATGGMDNMVRLWSIPGGAPLKTLEHHRDRVTALLFGADGRFLVSGSGDRTICLWKSELDRLRRVPLGQTTADDLEWTEQALFNSKLSEAERAWLEFLRGMMQWRRRFDIQLEESPRMAIGDFDIEIEG
jgi:WD40 repeat protein